MEVIWVLPHRATFHFTTVKESTIGWLDHGANAGDLPK